MLIYSFISLLHIKNYHIRSTPRVYVYNILISTMKTVSSTPKPGLTTGFVTDNTLYTETERTTTITSRETKDNSGDHSSVNIKQTINRQNSSLYTGSIFAAFNCDIQVNISKYGFLVSIILLQLTT